MNDCEVLAAADETDGDNTCCLHPYLKGHAGDTVCCWCGDLYTSDMPRTRHGEYLPKSPSRRKRK